MPVKNAGPFLIECLRSIQGQDDSNWELIAIDDHSNDESYQILDDFKSFDHRIRVFKNNHKGIIPALRLAYRNSTGTYITRMDADDIMTTEKISSLREALVRHGTGHVATGWVAYFSDTELGEGFRQYAQWLNRLTSEGNHYREVYKECVIPSPCWMVHRSDLDLCGAFAADVYPEDYDLCFRFYQYGLVPLGVDKVLHRWRDHHSRASRNDPHYADQRFFPLKLHYFLKLEMNPGHTLVLWGAGKKGKHLAKLLIDLNIDFRWVCNNPAKIGKHIYGVLLEDSRQVSSMDALKIIIAVTGPRDKNELNTSLSSLGLELGRDYYYFC